jgi:hypothetical protein
MSVRLFLRGGPPDICRTAEPGRGTRRGDGALALLKLVRRSCDRNVDEEADHFCPECGAADLGRDFGFFSIIPGTWESLPPPRECDRRSKGDRRNRQPGVGGPTRPADSPTPA